MAWLWFLMFNFKQKNYAKKKYLKGMKKKSVTSFSSSGYYELARLRYAELYQKKEMIISATRQTARRFGRH